MFRDFPDWIVILMKRIKNQMDYELLQRYIGGNVTAKEAEQVVGWLDADEENVKEFMLCIRHSISL